MNKGLHLDSLFQNKYWSRNASSDAHTALDKSPVQLSLERYWRANSTHPGNHHARLT